MGQPCKTHKSFGFWTRNLFVATGHYDPSFLACVGILTYIVVAILAYSGYVSKRDFPSYEELAVLTGKIVKLEKVDGGIDFELDGTDTKFRYASKAGYYRFVWEALRHATSATVGFKSEEAGRKTVYELRVNGRLIRPYEDISQRYKDDRDLLFWMVPIFFLLANYLLAVAHYTRKNDKLLEQEQQKTITRF